MEEEHGRGDFLPSGASGGGGGGVTRRSGAPQVDFAQRVGHPPGVNAPARVSSSNRDDRILQVFGSAGGGGTRGQGAEALWRKAASSRKDKSTNNNTALKKLRDLDILAKTCKRAGKLAQEASALYCRGVLLDNLERWGKAVESYEQYLALCETLRDVDGANVAYNCCGVAFFNLALNGMEAASRAVGLEHGKDESEGGECEGKGEGKGEDSKPRNDGETEAEVGAGGGSSFSAAVVARLRSAIGFHERHFESSDEPSQFVALCNLGLCYSRLGEHAKAVDFHQQALKLAIELQSPHGQSLAVGNLALTSMQTGDLETARACMDKHLHLVRDLENPEAETLACHQLGQMANRYGSYEDATQYFEEARRIAQATGEKGMLKLINCNLGVTLGNMRIKEHIAELLANQ